MATRDGSAREPIPLMLIHGAWLSARSSGHAAAFAQPKQVRAAVNQDFAGPGDPVGPGDEVAFFPPVTGG